MSDLGVLDELNRDIWHPFMRSYADRDAAAFLALHAPDLMRADAASGWVGGLEAYTERITAFFADVTRRGARIDIAFRFVERLTGGPVASERGVYKIIMAVPDEADRVFYGRFHTFARRVDDRWRIVVDYDTDDRGAVDEAAFAAAHDLEDPSPSRP